MDPFRKGMVTTRFAAGRANDTNDYNTGTSRMLENHYSQQIHNCGPS
jgi:hypothetical protein